MRGLSFWGCFTTELCITVLGQDAEAIRQARAAAEVDADLVELRLDSMTSPDPAAALADRRKPAIVTCRPLREGGMFDGAEEERLRILERAQALGAEFVDVEWDVRLEPFFKARGGRGVIVSHHDFDGVLPNLPALLRQLRSAGAEVAKLAVIIERASDLHALLEQAQPDGGSILIGMGRAGLATRVLAGRFGSRWTYAGGVPVGQVSASRLLQEFQFRRIRADASVYALLGRPAIDSLSPAMHNAGFAALGLNAVYVPVESRDVDGFREFASLVGMHGASVTIPFKRDVMPLVDEVAPPAAAAGAVNTIVIRAGRWIGMNTDADGFLEPLRKRLPVLAGVRAVILGAGGAARGVALALRLEGAHVAISARRPEAAKTVARAIGAAVAEWPPRPGSWDLLVNATPVGSAAEPGCVPFTGPFDGSLVYDLVYDPDPTDLMRAAELGKCPAIGGLEMLVAQAERQFEIWTGQRPPAGLFAGAASSALRGRSA